MRLGDTAIFEKAPRPINQSSLYAVYSKYSSCLTRSVGRSATRKSPYSSRCDVTCSFPTNLNYSVDNVNHSVSDLSEELQRELADRLPHGVYAHIASHHHEDFVLHADEQRACGKFSAKRIDDFVLGRYNAVQALQMLGIARQPIPMGSSREPVWPNDCVGSISHTEGLAGAIVASSLTYGGLGLDIERYQNLDSMATQFCTIHELENHRELPAKTQYLNIVFGAKEAIYKCIWPTVRRFISFKDVQLSIDTSCNQFQVEWHDSVHPDLSRVHGFWSNVHGYIAVVALLDGDDNQS